MGGNGWKEHRSPPLMKDSDYCEPPVLTPTCIAPLCLTPAPAGIKKPHSTLRASCPLLLWGRNGELDFRNKVITSIAHTHLIPTSTHLWVPHQGLKETKALLQLIGWWSLLIYTPPCREEVVGFVEGVRVVLGFFLGWAKSSHCLLGFVLLASPLRLQTPMAEDGDLRDGKSQAVGCSALDGWAVSTAPCVSLSPDVTWSRKF